MNEIWKNIKGYEGLYQISNLGRVKSLPRNTKNQYAYKERILKQIDDKDGYKIVGLSGKLYKVHRLVANAFITSINGKNIVNHKDGNKSNNRVENLEWCTNQENIIHAIEKGFLTHKKGINNPNSKRIVIKKDNLAIEFYSEKEVSKFLGVSKSAISNCLTGRSKSCKGYKIYYGEKN